MTTFAGHLFATLCLGTIFFHVALIAGLPLGAYTQGGRHRGALPPSGRAGAALAIFVTGFMGLAILSAAGFAGGFWPRWTGWAALVTMMASAALNLISPSAEERAVWGPVTVVMAGLAGYVMVVGAGHA